MMQKRHLVSGLAAFALMAGLFPASHAFAQSSGSGGTVVASGLANPRGIVVGDDGSVYVAEAGSGGPNVLKQGDSQLSWGYSGQIRKFAPDGTSTVVARNLPSGASDEGAIGIHDIIMAGGQLWGVIGGITGSTQNIPGEDSLIRIDPSTGVTTTVSDLFAFERQKNPDPNMIDSDAYGLTLGPDGMVYIADAAGNDVVKVNPNTGETSLVAVLPGLPLPAGMQAPPGGNPDRGGANELDPVPTGVAFGSDGNLYVSLLSGGPFPPGAARIMKVDSSGKVSMAAGGLTMVTDLKLGPDGNWYAAEFARFGDQGPAPHSGDIVRISPDGTSKVVVGGLDFPNKLAFDKSGNLYASVLSVTPAGQVVRYSPAELAAGVNTNAGSGTGTPGMPRTGQENLVPVAALFASLMLLGIGLAARRSTPGRTV